MLCADALVLAREALVPLRARLLDVGAGAGAPGLVLLLLRPDLDGTLLEPLRKRVAFLRTAVGALDLAGRARVVEDRLDPARPEVAGAPFDVALSRATFAPDRWLPLGLRLAKRALVLTAAAEPPAGPRARAVAEARYAIPSSGAARRITAYELAQPQPPPPQERPPR